MSVLNEPGAPTIGVDVGGTKIAAAVVDASGGVIARRELATDAERPQAVVAAVTKVIHELHAAAPAVSAVGVGAAGLVDLDGRIVAAPHLAWRDLPLRDLLRDRARLPVVVDNDANVAAWGEHLHGAGRGAGDLLLLTVGTGIGGGLVLNGHLHRGAHGFASEVGHMVVDPDGPECACGRQGCFEVLASGKAIGTETGEAASAGDPAAIERVAEAGRWLGLGISNLVHVLDPDIVIVSGGAAARHGERLLGPARTVLEASMMHADSRKPPPLLAGALGADSGVVGAAALARDLA